MIYALGTDNPQIASDAFIAPDANIIGKIVVNARASVWFGATLRGDNEIITVGEGSNIQEGCVLHTDIGFPLTIGSNVTVGHKAMLHGCHIGEQSLIGMGAIILNGAQIGRGCLIGAGALVTEGKVIPDGAMVLGAPGKVVRQLDEEAIANLKLSAMHYQENAQRFFNELKLISN